MSQNIEASQYLSDLKKFVNSTCEGKEAWEIIVITFVTTWALLLINKILTMSFYQCSSQNCWYYIRKFPVIKQAVEKKFQSTVGEIEKQVHKGLEDKVFIQQVPEKAWSLENIVKEIDKYLDFGKYNWQEGYVSGTVYTGNDDGLKRLVQQVYNKTAYTNPLHPDVFPGIRVMEAEIIQMVSSLFKAKESIGAVTSGGTESIFLVCKAYRDYAKSVKNISNPNMVIPVTAHAAFDKAAHMLKIEVKHVKINPDTMKVNIKAMKKAIDSNTCMIVGSAPAFPHGCIDDIAEIGQLGYKYNIPVHVDACLGGFLLPFIKKAGFPDPKVDFTVKGVTSISVDTHKYAFAPKGTSVILYKDKIYRHYQYSVQPDWPGGIYGTPNLSGSRSGGLIATCWASLLYHGEEKYVECTKKIMHVTKYLDKGLRNIKGIHVFGNPDVSVIAIGSKSFDAYRLSSALTERGWNLNILQFPPGFHICVTMQHTYEGVADKFLTDVEECTAEILRDPHTRTTGTAAIYGMASQIPDRSLVSEIVWAYLDACLDTPANKTIANGK